MAIKEVEDGPKEFVPGLSTFQSHHITEALTHQPAFVVTASSQDFCSHLGGILLTV